jgi:hypothetical protein
MPDLPSDEKIYAELEDIRRRAEIIRDSHSAMLLNHKPPPAVTSICYSQSAVEVAPDVYRALVDLADRVAAIADEYAEFYHIPK